MPLPASGATAKADAESVADALLLPKYADAPVAVALNVADSVPLPLSGADPIPDIDSEADAMPIA